MNRINTRKLDLGLVILFISFLLRYLIKLPDFIYGIGLGISGTLAAIFISEYRSTYKG